VQLKTILNLYHWFKCFVYGTTYFGDDDMKIRMAMMALNGTLRRDRLDHLIVIDDVHADRVLKEYVCYCLCRPHRGLRMQPPIGARCLPTVWRIPPNDVVCRLVLGGLRHEFYARAAWTERRRTSGGRAARDSSVHSLLLRVSTPDLCTFRPKSGAAHPSPRPIAADRTAQTRVNSATSRR
jgi:hypothetical protein